MHQQLILLLTIPNKIPKKNKLCLPVLDVDVGLLGPVGVDDVAAPDEDAVLGALHVVHVLQRGRGGVGRRHGSLITLLAACNVTQCSVFNVEE